ncbi:MAG TPA: phosphoribosylglycinamide formyltransferase [Candidatus Manganitrophaceae bacterium]|nr:phosphoribosylglycinamide formyltransferase [Candidatus Manganitrophaceae bacterium]
MSKPDRSTPPSSAGALVIGVLASGRGSNLQSIIDAIEQGKLAARIGLVLSNKKEAQALERAERHHLPTLFLDPLLYSDRSQYDAAIVEALQSHRVELVVLAGYMRLLTTVLVHPYQDRIINIHPSLLPAFPGLHAHRQALAYGAKVSGCTIHFVDEKVDHGPIIAQAAVPVLEEDDEQALSERILIEEHRLLPKVLQLYADGKLRIDGRKVRIEGETSAEDGPIRLQVNR